MKLIEFTDIENLNEQVRISKIPVLVCFWDESNFKCRGLKSDFKYLIPKYKNEYKNKLKLLLVDVNKCPEDSLKAWDVSSTPTLILFSQGEEKYRASENIEQKTLRREIASLLTKKPPTPIELQFLKFQQYQENTRCLLRLKIKNLLHNHVVNKASVIIGSNSFDKEYAEDINKNLYDQSLELVFDPKPIDKGIALINLQIECWDEENTVYKLAGKTWVYVRGEKAGDERYFRDIILNIERDFIGDIENIAKIIESEKQGKEQTVVIEPKWETIKLDLVSVRQIETPSDISNRKFVEDTPGGIEITTSLLLRCKEPEKSIFIFTKSDLVLGKQRKDKDGKKINDIVLRIYPEDVEENDDRSKKISRMHAIISLKKGQFFIKDWDWIRNKGSKNGTFVNKQEIPKNVDFLLKDGSIIDFAGELKLQLLTFRHIQTKKGDLVTSIDGKSGDITSACLKRLNNWGDREEYIILVKHLTIGKTPENCLVLSDDSILDRHVRLHYLNKDRLWIEDFSGGNTWLDEKRLSVNTLYLLREGVSLKVGNLSLNVSSNVFVKNAE